MLLIDIEAARLSRLNTICIVVTVVLVTCSEQLGYNLEHRRYHSIGLASCAHFPAFADGRSGAEKGGCACIGAADNRRPDPFSCSLRSVSRAFLPSVKEKSVAVFGLSRPSWPNCLQKYCEHHPAAARNLKDKSSDLHKNIHPVSGLATASKVPLHLRHEPVRNPAVCSRPCRVIALLQSDDVSMCTVVQFSITEAPPRCSDNCGGGVIHMYPVIPVITSQYSSTTGYRIFELA